MFKIKTFKILLFALSIMLFSCKEEETNSLDENLTFAVNFTADGDFKKANNHLERAFEQAGENLNENLYLVKAKIQALQSKPIDEILTSLRKALKYAPKNYLANFEIGEILYKQKKYDDSIISLKNAIKCDKTQSAPVLILAEIYKNLKQPKESLKYYGKLLNMENYKVKKIDEKITDKKEKKKAKAAAELYNKKITAELYNEIGCRYLEIGKNKKNIENAVKYIYLKAYPLDKKNHQIILNIATLCDIYLNKPKIAVEYYAKYWKMTRKNPQSYDLLKKVEARVLELDPTRVKKVNELR